MFRVSVKLFAISQLPIFKYCVYIYILYILKLLSAMECYNINIPPGRVGYSITIT